MKTRGLYRHNRSQDMDRLVPERLDGFDRRASTIALLIMAGPIRVVCGEAPSPQQRRQYPDAGMK